MNEKRKKENSVLNKISFPDNSLVHLVLKLDKEIDIRKLWTRLDWLMSHEAEILEHGKKRWTWRLIAEQLLRADGSWAKRPEFYKKF